MIVLEQKADKIFKLNNDLNHFIKTNAKINKLYQKFKNESLAERSKYDFLFDKTFDNNKKLVDIYLEKNPKLPKKEKAAFMELKNTINSVFEVKAVNKEGFELYNLVNEKVYRVKNLIKMVNYRNIFKENYLTCRIIPFEGEFFLFTVDKVMKTSEKTGAYKLAVQKQLDSPCSAYGDNDDKFREIEKNVTFLGKNFNHFFKNNEVVTLNSKVNELLDAFNDYVDNLNTQACPDSCIEHPKEPNEYSYFNVNKKKNASRVYDVGLLFDPETGLQTVPFFATFCKIFETNDYKSIEGYQDCVKDFFNNDKVSPYALRMAYERFGEEFTQRAKQILKLRKEIDFEELLHKYKSILLKEKRFSTPAILYSSEAFETLMELSAKNEVRIPKIEEKFGRNNPCPCGSGKKYKKCCL